MNARPTNWNPGGGAEIRLLPIEGIAQFSPVSGELVRRPGYSWQAFYFTPGTLGYDDEESETDNGPIHKISIELFCPNDAPTYSPLLDQLTAPGVRLIVRLRDYAGSWRSVGGQFTGLVLTYKFSTGSNVPDSRGYTLKLTGEFDKAATLISSATALNG